MKRKLSKIFLALIILFISLTPQTQKVEAVGPAAPAVAPAAILGGGGFYVSGALMLGAIAAGMGYDQYSEDINAHAARVWDSTTAASKASLEMAIDAAYKAGNLTIDIPQNVYAELKTKFNEIYNDPMNFDTPSSLDRYFVQSTTASANLSLGDGLIWQHEINGNIRQGLTLSFSMPLTKVGPDLEYEWTYKIGNYGAAIRVPNGTPRPTTFAGVLALASQANPTVKLTRVEPRVFDDVAALKDRGVFEWSPATDTPRITLPRISDYTVTDTATGARVRWQDETGAFTDTAGNVVPNERLKVANPTLTLEGDVPAYTTGDGAIVAAPDGAIIKEGEATTTPGEGTGTGEVPFNPGSSTGINWPKLKAIPAAFTTAFPFSLPFDIGRALDATFKNVSDSKQKIEFEFKFQSVDSPPFKIPFPDYFMGWIPYVHNFILISFDISFIYAIYRLLGGAS